MKKILLSLVAMSTLFLSGCSDLFEQDVCTFTFVGDTDYGNVEVNNTTMSRSISVSCTETKTVTATLSGNTTDFTINHTSQSVDLWPELFILEFVPQSTGSKSVKLVLKEDGSDNTFERTFVGTGIQIPN